MSNAWEKASKKVKSGNRPQSSGDVTDIFMRIPDGTHQIRIVGEPRPVYIAWLDGGKKVVVPDEPEYIEKVTDVLDGNIRSNLVVNVIDRADQKERLKEGKGTRFKLLEKGPSIFDAIITDYEINTDDDGNPIPPGGKLGHDWTIVAKVPKDPRQTKYQVVKGKQTPFTKEELSVIKRADKNGKNVKEEFKNLPLGERGLIDFDFFYDEEKAKKIIDDLVNGGDGNIKNSDAKSNQSDDFDDDSDTDQLMDDDSQDIAASASFSSDDDKEFDLDDSF